MGGDVERCVVRTAVWRGLPLLTMNYGYAVRRTYAGAGLVCCVVCLAVSSAFFDVEHDVVAVRAFRRRRCTGVQVFVFVRTAIAVTTVFVRVRDLLKSQRLLLQLHRRQQDTCCMRASVTVTVPHH